MRTNSIFILLLLVFCAGCGTVVTGLNADPYPVYGGVRQDAKLVSDGGPGIMWMVDMPVSFAADTLLLPLGVYDLKFTPPSVDPLKGWNSWSPGDEEPQPTEFYDWTTHTANNTLPPKPPKHSRLDKTIKDDYLSYLKKHEPAYFEGGTSFYEDQTGQHAVKVRIGRNGYYRVYIFWYDKNNVRVKVTGYANGGYAC